MALLADIATWVFLLAGSFCAVVSGIGMVRNLPDVYARMHPASISDTLAAGLILVGLTFQAGFTLVTVKLLLTMVLILYTSPAATHALAKAARHGGLEPMAKKREAPPS
jgi:multicomponent Na+:H+ antiporter subunit G